MFSLNYFIPAFTCSKRQKQRKYFNSSKKLFSFFFSSGTADADARCKSCRRKKSLQRNCKADDCNSVTRFGEISPLWQNFKSLWLFFEDYFLLAKIFTSIGQIFMILDKFWMFFMAQSWKDNLTIWSHCFCIPRGYEWMYQRTSEHMHNDYPQKCVQKGIKWGEEEGVDDGGGGRQRCWNK